MPPPRRGSGLCPRPSWHSPGSRARVAAPRSRSAALRHAAASARRRQQRLPILCQRCSPGVPRGGGAGPGPAPAAPRPIPKRAARGCEGFLARVAGPPGTRRWPGGLQRWAGQVGRPRPVSLRPSTLPSHKHMIAVHGARVEPRWREPCRPFSFCCTSQGCTGLPRSPDSQDQA